MQSTFQKIIVTGGAGFIGSAFIRHVLARYAVYILNIDKLTYAGNLKSLHSVADHPHYQFAQTDINNASELNRLFADFRPDAVVHFAAESHVDRSIAASNDFITTNIVGTHTLLDTARGYFQTLDEKQKNRFRFLHVSTDEVYGDRHQQVPNREHDPYAPSSPYAASKAAADHLVQAWQRTYGLPTLISHCSNNYGPCQYPEKLIPRIIQRARRGQSLPIYGDGSQSRDWLYVEDHVRALWLILQNGRIGQPYHIASGRVSRNIDLVHVLCQILEDCAPDKPQGIRHYRDLIQHITDRAGHDRAYALDASRIQNELGWQPQTDLQTGLQQTVAWYLAHPDWFDAFA